MRHVLRQRRRFRLIVTLKSGAAYSGILYDHDSQTIVLRKAELLMPTPAAPVPLDGELLVFVADIDTIQRV